MNLISLTVQDGEYLGERDSFHKAANRATKALGYNHMKESKQKNG